MLLFSRRTLQFECNTGGAVIPSGVDGLMQQGKMIVPVSLPATYLSLLAAVIDLSG